MLTIVSHDNEREEKGVVVFRSQENIFSQVCLDEVIIVDKEVASILIKDDETKVCSIIEEFQFPSLSL